MKKTILIVILFNAFCAFAQIEIPFLESFEDDSFLNKKEIFLASLKDPVKGYNWNLSTDFQNQQKSLKITVHNNDHPQNANFPRSRAEISINFNNNNHETYYYSWKVFIPNNEEFIEDTSGYYDDNGNARGGFHKISQILNSTYEYGNKINVENRKLLGMEYKHDPNSPNSKKRDLYLLLYNASHTNRKYARISIDNAIKKGEWNEFIYKIHWSENEDSLDNNDYGFMNIWINRMPVISIQEEVHHDQKNGSNVHTHDLDITKYNCVVANTNEDDPTLFKFPNMSFTNDANPLPVHNILKLGHYRKYHSKEHNLYVDDIRFTKEFPPAQNRTKLLPEYCGVDIYQDNKIVSCYEVPGATEYIAKFVYDGIEKYAGLGNSTALNLNNVDFLEAGKSYDVSIRAAGVENSGYGEICNINIPLKTKLLPEYCGVNIYQNNTLVSCYEVPGVTEYIAKFEYDGIEKYAGMGSSTVLNLNNVDFLEVGKSYAVSIRAAGVENSGYGPSCDVQMVSAFSKKHVEVKTNLKRDIEYKVYPNPFADLLHVQGQLSTKEVNRSSL